MSTDERANDDAGLDDSRDDAAGPVDVRDLLGAYALDAVDDVERRSVERLAAADPEFARELAGFTATAAMLGGAVGAPPPAEVRGAVLAQITRTPQLGPHGSAPVHAAPPPAPAGGATRHSGASPRTVWIAVAATALGAAVIPSAVAWQQAQAAHRFEQQAQVLTDVLADSESRVVHANIAGGGVAVGVLASERALFTASGLAGPGTGKVYQLWVFRDGRPLPDTVLADEEGRVRAVTDHFAAGDSLAVTIEPAGGSLQPTTKPIVVLTAG